MNFLTLQSNFLTLAFSVLFPDMYFLTFLDTVVLFLDNRVSSTPTWREFLESRVNFLTVPVRNFLTLQSNFQNAGWNFEYMYSKHVLTSTRNTYCTCVLVHVLVGSYKKRTQNGRRTTINRTLISVLQSRSF
eukprot:COSAG02_NODE_129_length_34796_cov_26.576015_34_plen_132_part_00